MGRVFGNDNPGLTLGTTFTAAETLAVQQIGALADPNADRILFWDDSAGAYKYLAVGTGLTITGTTLDASGGSGATTALDNLASVAINTTLVSDTDNTDDIGTAAAMWRTGYFKTSLELGHASDTTLTRSAAGVLAVEGVVIPSVSSTNTLTNKRVTPRVTSISSSATPTINTDNCDAVTITALAAAITSMTTNLSGTPNNFDKLTIRIKDDGTARAITWGASFEAKGVALPTTTVISKVLTVGFIYDSVSAKWGCVASAQEV